MLPSFHPTIWVALAVFAGAIVSGLSSFSLLVVSLVLNLAAVFLVRQSFFRLVRRTRWLLLSVLMLFTWGTPGEYVQGPLSFLWLTYDGLAAAGEHGLRLLALLALVTLLTEGLTAPRMAAGFASLLAPLRWLGLDTDRAARRLMLVLALVEQAPAQAGWRFWLLDPPDDLASVPVLSVQPAPLHPRDGIALVVLVGAACLWWWS